jgi:hypothetical protein
MFCLAMHELGLSPLLFWSFPASLAILGCSRRCVSSPRYGTIKGTRGKAGSVLSYLSVEWFLSVAVNVRSNHIRIQSSRQFPGSNQSPRD